MLAEAVAASNENINVDLTQLFGTDFQSVLMVDGYAVAPLIDTRVNGKAQASGPARPAWADRVLTATATGQAPDNIDDASKRRKLAVTAARVEAVRRLWLKIDKLDLPEGETFEERLAAHPELLNELSVIDEVIFPLADPSFSDEGTATVTVGVRLETVWRIIRDTLWSK